MTIPIRTADGRVVAVIDGQALFKKVDSTKHMLRKPPSWAFDRATIEEAQAAGATKIEVWAADEGITYKATMAHFLEYSFALNRGHNAQLAMPLRYWEQDHDELAANIRYGRQLGLSLPSPPEELA